jgi:hypothetical protein
MHILREYNQYILESTESFILFVLGCIVTYNLSIIHLGELLRVILFHRMYQYCIEALYLGFWNLQQTLGISVTNQETDLRSRDMYKHNLYTRFLYRCIRLVNEMWSHIDRKMGVNSSTQREQTVKETVEGPRVICNSGTSWSVLYCLLPAVLQDEMF